MYNYILAYKRIHAISNYLSPLPTYITERLAKLLLAERSEDIRERITQEVKKQYPKGFDETATKAWHNTIDLESLSAMKLLAQSLGLQDPETGAEGPSLAVRRARHYDEMRNNQQYAEESRKAIDCFYTLIAMTIAHLPKQSQYRMTNLDYEVNEYGARFMRTLIERMSAPEQSLKGRERLAAQGV